MIQLLEKGESVVPNAINGNLYVAEYLDAQDTIGFEEFE